MRAAFQIIILLYLLSSDMVEPRTRQITSVGSSGAAPFPKILRRRTYSVELIDIRSSGGSSNDKYEKGKLQSGIMMTLDRSLLASNLEGLNHVIQKNQMEVMEQAPKLNMFTNDNHERLSLVSRLSQRYKKVMIKEVTEPNNFLRMFSLGMSLPADADFSMSISLAMTESADIDLAIAEERDFFSRSVSLSMLASLPEDGNNLQSQMNSMCMSMDFEMRSVLVRVKVGRIIVVERITSLLDRSISTFTFSYFRMTRSNQDGQFNH
jgi:hypothetical protein